MKVIEHIPLPQSRTGRFAIKVVRCNSCQHVADVSTLESDVIVMCDQCAAHLRVPAESEMFRDAEALVLFLNGSLPADVEPVAGIVYSLAASTALALGAASVVIVGVAAAIVRVDTLSDESPEVQAVLEQTVYEKSVLGTRIFMTSPIYSLPPPLRSAMTCLVKSRRL